MSPKYSLALVLALTLFFTATSLTDDLKPKSRNQPSTTLDNELTQPKTKSPGNGKALKNELAVPTKPPHNGGSVSHVKELAKTGKPPNNGRSGGGHNVNELTENVNPRKGHGHDPKEPHVNEEAVFINNRKSKAGEYHVAKDSSNHGGKPRPGDPTDTSFNKNKGKKNKLGGPDTEN